ncbi:Glycosyltransferase involved in cell wall bisynthesis [Maribacter orientalis]|uniref:Glycosyltransferase involved in cell wall bisynthesis n=1 Tax=Maribacter orientalis TaxID=228957 RepID=A0A1H7SHP7_9FLAO|nr:glycosyltransferase family 2 protein [Maribacter orientalis]SEL72152.1 Glycosyltransferase involved in cell wall bisynthesis [Maribacter orientalis]
MNLNKFLPIIKPYKKGHYQFKFSLFIPVYNGEKTINRALKSIEKQTYKDFEIIIIDDGSTDNTEGEVREFMTTSKYPIRFFKNVENIHKLGTILRGISLAQGEFFLIHDADDECLPNALEIYNEAYESIPNSEKKKISGITANCIDQHGNFIGTNIKEDYIYCNSFDFSFKYKIQGEKWGPTKTDVLRQIEIDKSIFGRGLIPEAYLWNTVDKAGYLTKFLNSVTRVYYTNNDDNLSSLKYDKKSFGMAIYSLLFINYFQKNHIVRYPKPFFKRLVSIVIASCYLEFSLKDFYESLHNWFLKISLVLLWPFRKNIKKLTKM